MLPPQPPAAGQVSSSVGTATVLAGTGEGGGSGRCDGTTTYDRLIAAIGYKEQVELQ